MRVDLKSDTLWYGSAVMIERALGLLLLPLLTRRLTEAEYGIWAQAAVVSSVLMPLVLVSLPTGIVRYFSAGLDASRRRLWMGRSLSLALGLWGLLALAAWCLPDTAALAVYGVATQTRFVAVALILLAADAIFDLLIAYLRADFRMRHIAALLVLRGSLRFGFLLVALGPLALPFDVAFERLAALQLLLVALGFAAEFLRRTSEPPASDAVAPRPTLTWRTMLGFTAPLVLMSALSSAHSYTDRFVLTHQLGLEATAVYAAVATVVSVVNVACTVLGFTLFPVLSSLWTQGDRARAAALAAEATRVFLFIALPFVFWLACVSDRLLPLLATQAYRVPVDVVLMLGLAAVSFGLYQIVLYVLLLTGQGSRVVAIMLLAALLNAGLNVLWVARFGLSGAAAAAALSNGLLAALACGWARRFAQVRFPWIAAARIAAGAVLAALASQLFSPSVATMPWIGLALSLAILAGVHVAVDVAMPLSLIRAHLWRPAR